MATLKKVFNAGANIRNAIGITAIFGGLALVAAFDFAGQAGGRSINKMEQVTLAETFDYSSQFPTSPAGNVSGFSMTFDGRHNGLMTRRTLQFPCNTFAGKSVEDNVKAISAFRIALNPKAREQAEDILLTARNGVCAPTLK